MEGILKVTPEKLIQASGTFATTGTQVKNLTGELMTGSADGSGSDGYG